jgi:phage tail sheath protein FI
MPATVYATPGVYVEEISTLPPSIAEVGTAIPAFIGSTTNHDEKGPVVVKEVNSLRQYEDLFGRSPASPWQVRFNPATGDFSLQDTQGKPVGPYSQPAALLWYAIDHYFRNGGSRCYVVSVAAAKADAPPSVEKFRNGLKELERYDEPTLILVPEASQLSPSDFGEVCEAALAHAGKLQDRFVILDAKLGSSTGLTNEDLLALRSLLGTQNLDRGAIYFPFLLTTLPHVFSEDSLEVIGLPSDQESSGSPDSAADVSSAKSGSDRTPPTTKASAAPATLASLATTRTSDYNVIKKLLTDQRVILPPSAAVAGVVVSVDRERGVWKAPANVSLQAVVAPVLQLTDEDQAKLNIDASTGKSINGIRSFAGKGTLVWGARTLAGNDNEWRYISVRRLFITIEESVKQATAFAVFEPNDSSTWLKVKGMIDSFLYSLWERGALQGAKPEEAFFVHVGLNKTMTSDDILNGLLIVEIGLAAVRPAEFISLRFSHKLAQ